MVFGSDLNLIMLVVLLFIFGFGIGAFMLCFAVGKEANPIIVAATIVSMINLGDPIFGSFTEPLVGKLLDLSWHGQLADGIRVYSAMDYRVALSILPVYLIAAALFLRSVKGK